MEPVRERSRLEAEVRALERALHEVLENTVQTDAQYRYLLGLRRDELLKRLGNTA